MQVIASKALEGVILKAIHGGGERRGQVRLDKTCEGLCIYGVLIGFCKPMHESFRRSFSGNQDQGGEVNKQA